MSGAEPSIFTRIINGEIPCHKIFEDDSVFAFLDINPFARGHTLVVPKEEAETLDQLSEESAAAVGRVLPQICRAVMAASGAESYNILQNNGGLAGQTVFHVHFHIVPKPSLEEGLVGSVTPRSLCSEEGAEIAERIRSYL